MISKTTASLVLMFCGIAFAALWAAYPQALHQSPSSAEPRDTFVKNCATCHGRDGRSKTPVGKAMNAADLTSARVQAQSNTTLAHFISGGGGQMPAFKSVLSQQQIAGQVQYIRSLRGAASRK